ncbi:hypothetical protein L0F51_00280 [Afifella sp. H1R]|uniref:phage baseplate plug family protein n=1 Tax=Afifella sp. H1R TaxID=2908841 RepID=UPI001F1B1893|nr:hypothetical protein [Afifella sp. H1R]MCF1502201.1 hypothetical protein [Afifella sp. H1R]
MREFTIIDAADQKFTAIFGNRRATIRLRYSVFAKRWAIDLSIDDEPVMHGRRLVLNVDVLKTLSLGIGAIFIAAETDGAEPNRENLPGGLVRMYHATEEEVAAAAALA